jgi:hypothetical protein
MGTVDRRNGFAMVAHQTYCGDGRSSHGFHWGEIIRSVLRLESDKPEGSKVDAVLWDWVVPIEDNGVTIEWASLNYVGLL